MAFTPIVSSPKHAIAVVGIWHLGEIFSAGLAELEHRVVGISEDEATVDNLSKNIPPLAEPGLVDLLRTHQSSGRLSYSTEFDSVKDCDTLWFTFDTPVNDRDEADWTCVRKALEKSLPFLREGVLIAVTSQIPVGASVELQSLIKKTRPGLRFEYVYIPENLRLGEAVRNFLNPGHIVIGAENNSAFQLVEEIFSGLQANFLRMSLASAEMVKHALNAFLATSLAFTYDIADLCEQVGADVTDVILALKSDGRVGPKAYLDANVGFSGGTLGRDLKALLLAAQKEKLDLDVIGGVWRKNERRRLIVPSRLGKILGSLDGKIVALFGLTYKAGTSTLRRSLALEIAKDLGRNGAVVRLCDPHADVTELSPDELAVFSADPYKAAAGAQAVVVVTPCSEFKDLDFGRLRKVMAAPAVFLDGRNFLAGLQSEIVRSGFVYIGIGRG